MGRALNFPSKTMLFFWGGGKRLSFSLWLTSLELRPPRAGQQLSEPVILERTVAYQAAV